MSFCWFDWLIPVLGFTGFKSKLNLDRRLVSEQNERSDSIMKNHGQCYKNNDHVIVNYYSLNYFNKEISSENG